MKVDFQARLSKKNGLRLDEAVFLNETFEISTPDNQRCVQVSKLSRAVKIEIFNSKIPFICA